MDWTILVRAQTRVAARGTLAHDLNTIKNYWNEARKNGRNCRTDIHFKFWKAKNEILLTTDLISSFWLVLSTQCISSSVCVLISIYDFHCTAHAFIGLVTVLFRSKIFLGRKYWAYSKVLSRHNSEFMLSPLIEME